MKTDTDKRIFEFIKKNKQVTPKEIIDFIGFGAPAVFRQLKKLQNQGRIKKTGKPPIVFYHLPVDKKEEIVQNIFTWVRSKDGQAVDSLYCPTHDIFKARQNKLPRELSTVIDNEQLVFLLSAVVGEIGNNSFDHNFGNWPNIPGIYFQTNTAEGVIVLADRGNGVFSTIKKIKTDVKDDVEALRVAFTEIISGRAPEHRGNGLKFVRRVMEEEELKLKFYSGQAVCVIDGKEMNFLKSSVNIKGTIAIVEF